MYIVAIMITAVIFSVTGIGVLNLASIVNLDTQEAVHTVQDRIEVESFANVALWRLNAGGDSLGTFSSGDLSSSYDSTTMELTITKTADDETNGLRLDLEEDSHFKRAVASANWIDYNNRSVNEEADHKVRDHIGFIPNVDLQYFLDNADTIFYQGWRDYEDRHLKEGINVFYGNYIDIEDIDKENTTLVFMGYNVEFKYDINLSAPINGGSPLPAVIIANPYTELHLDQSRYHTLHIEGAIYSTGYVKLHEGEFSGPVVAKYVRFCRDIDMLDDQYSEYYEWNTGFGLYEDYDWPKQIMEWETI